MMVTQGDSMADDTFDIVSHLAKLRQRAAERCDIDPADCHLGHITQQGMLDYPNALHQIDSATGASETNLSVVRRVSRLSSAMSHYGIKPGDAIIIMGANHLDVCIPFYACTFGGFSVCAMDPSVPSEDLDKLFPFIFPKMVFCEKSCEEKIRKAYKVNRQRGEVVVFGDKTADMESLIRNYSGFHVNFRPPVIDQAKINSWLIMTSGTTGCPKVAMISFKNVLNGMIAWWSPFTMKIERAMAMAPLQWLSSLIYFTCTPLAACTRVQSSAPLTPDRLIALINIYRPHVTVFTPFVLNRFMMKIETAMCDLTCFKFIGIGGAAPDKALVDKLRNIIPNTYLFLTYGMTELVVPVFNYNDDTPFGSVGKPFKDRFEYKLLDDNNQIVKQPKVPGELWIKGDAFFSGYLNNPEETATMLTDDGWFKTGDIFYRTDKDYYYFVERKRLIIRHYGTQISPLQMEEIIKRHPGISDACVVGIPDPDCLERPVAAIIRRNGDNVEPKEVFSLIKSNMTYNRQLSGGLFFVDAFPMTPSGKVHRSKLKEMAITTESNIERDNTQG